MKSATKRAFDILVSATLLVVLSPVFIAAAAGILISSSAPIFYRQIRSGRRGRLFSILKFRTMHEGSPHPNHETWRDDPRVFPLGRILREYHIDELPQLWNVLVGDMSIVGPRPGLPHQVDRYTEEQKERLLVRPGITGLAQVSGNNELDWDERIEVDRRYMQEMSIWLDIKILMRTIVTVLRKEGIYGADGAVRDKK